jgi:deoxyribodipyrimidine photolyase-related protein
MLENRELYTRFPYHAKRLAFLIEASRHHADTLRSEGYKVSYDALGDGEPGFGDHLKRVLMERQCTKLGSFEIEDRFLHSAIVEVVEKLGIAWHEEPNPLFLHARDEIRDLLGKKKRPFMKTFYEHERKKRGILMEEGEPAGGKFSFDAENRKRLPRSVSIPERPRFSPSKHRDDVSELITTSFPDHPGEAKGLWMPTTREGAREALDFFIERYGDEFGPYEDAISQRDPFLFHSALSPLINVGLLTPDEVVQAVESADGMPLQSREGYIRQVIGWREFIRGIDLCFGERQARSNFFNHTRGMKPSWYNGTTGILPLDDAIKKAIEYGYCHHIERLMILSNLMFLCEIDPSEVYSWFMTYFVDSADWVMGPNVYGMGQFSDGGIFATKPYMCGSNYLLKMSDYKKEAWCDIVDGLYWRKVEKERPFFEKQPRLMMMVRSLDRMEPSRKSRLFDLAEAFIETTTF